MICQSQQGHQRGLGTWPFLKMTLETESMEVAEEKKVGKEELTVQFTSEKGWENSWNEKKNFLPSNRNDKFYAI